MSVASSVNFGKYVPINFGLPHADLNWRLGFFIDANILNKMPLNPHQVDAFADILDWRIMSRRKLPSCIFVKHKNHVHWDILLTLGRKLDEWAISEVPDKIRETAAVFSNDAIKLKYYTVSFILAFQDIIDYDWVVKNIKLSEYILLKLWNRFNIDAISKYQNITYLIAQEKLKQINWKLASKCILTEEIISYASQYVDWTAICTYQLHLSEEFLVKFDIYLDWQCVSRYQTLTSSFMRRYAAKLDWNICSEFQNMSTELIRDLEELIDFNKLLKNKNYNTGTSMQILTNGTNYFIIDQPVMGEFCQINYLSARYIDLG